MSNPLLVYGYQTPRVDSIEYQSGQPCSTNCERHRSHPCEICGRIKAEGIVTLPLDEDAKKRLKLRLKLWKIKK